MNLKPLLLALALVASVAQATPTTSTSLSGGGATWQNIGNTPTGFGLIDANIGGHGDAFDNALTLRVNNQLYASNAIFDVTDQLVTAPTVLLSGISTRATFYADLNSPTLRTIFTFTNTTAAALDATVNMQTNVGSDSDTQILGSSSGDTNFTTADRWLVTDDRSTTSGDAANTHVLWGSGGLAPTLVDTNVFFNAGTQGVLAEFVLSLAAGETRSIMFLNQIHVTGADALADALQFDALGAGSSMLTGLSNDDLLQIANWRLGIEPADGTVPEPSSLALAGLAMLGLGRVTRRSRRAQRAALPR